MAYLVSEDHTTFIPSARLVQAAKPSTELVSRDIRKVLGTQPSMAIVLSAHRRTTLSMRTTGTIKVVPGPRCSDV
ncbi:hypothetical protein GCM10029978_117370 [Actinoallomurus acanthiterrae]